MGQNNFPPSKDHWQSKLFLQFVASLWLRMLVIHGRKPLWSSDFNFSITATPYLFCHFCGSLYNCQLDTS